MSMKKWLTAAAVMAVSASLAVAMPQGGNGWGGHRGHHGAMSEKLAQKLNLTDTQKQQVKDLNTAFRQQNKAFFEAAHQTRQ
jgi:Spy/CpxP family protein refolding chaperone